MSDESWDDDEDWYDEPDQPDEWVVECPECGAAMAADAGMCPKCGYWLTEADRRAMEAGPRGTWIKIVAVVALIAFVTVFVLAIAL
jgi:predicted nucleic acid-binding Zn ribbon protein